MDKNLVTIANCVKQSCAEAHKEGIAKGLAVAERILVWFVANQTMKEPHPQETLENWAKVAISDLRKELV